PVLLLCPLFQLVVCLAVIRRHAIAEGFHISVGSFFLRKIAELHLGHPTDGGFVYEVMIGGRQRSGRARRLLARRLLARRLRTRRLRPRLLRLRLVWRRLRHRRHRAERAGQDRDSQYFPHLCPPLSVETDKKRPLRRLKEVQSESVQL